MRLSTVFAFFFLFLSKFVFADLTTVVTDSIQFNSIETKTQDTLFTDAYPSNDSCFQIHRRELQFAKSIGDSVLTSRLLSEQINCYLSSGHVTDEKILSSVQDFFIYNSSDTAEQVATQYSFLLAQYFNSIMLFDSSQMWIDSAISYCDKPKSRTTLLDDSIKMNLYNRSSILSAQNNYFDQAVLFLLHYRKLNDEYSANHFAKKTNELQLNWEKDSLAAIASIRKLNVQLNKKKQQLSFNQSKVQEEKSTLEIITADLSSQTEKLNQLKSATDQEEIDVRENEEQLAAAIELLNAQLINTEQNQHYGYIAAGLVLLFLFAFLYIRLHLYYSNRAKAQAILYQIKQTRLQIASRGKLAVLGQLTNSVAQQINQPIASIEKVSSEIIPIINSIDPADTSGRQMNQLLKVKSSIQFIHEKGYRAGQVVRTMLVQTSSKMDEAEYSLNQLISDCLLLINQPSIEYAESEKHLRIFISRPGFQRILLSLLQNSLDAIRKNQEKSGMFPKFIRIVTAKENEFVLIKVTDNRGMNVKQEPVLLNEKVLINDEEEQPDVEFQFIREMVLENKGRIEQSTDPSGKFATVLLKFPIST